MSGLWEPEEAVGRWWHRWVGAAPSYPRYPDAAVRLDTMSSRLAVFFRGLGGPGALRVAGVQSDGSRHRLRLRQRLGFGEAEPWEQPRLDHEALLLPLQLDCFASTALNERLYFWLAAFFAHAEAPPQSPQDPLQADLLALRTAQSTVRRTLCRWPGLRAPYRELMTAVRAIRPQRRLDGTERDLERVILHLLGHEALGNDRQRTLWAAVTEGRADLGRFRAPRGYRTYLPVPLWGAVAAGSARDGQAADPDEPTDGGGEPGDGRRRRAKRRHAEQAERDDSLILNRFETLLAVAEMINLNRNVEDDEPDAARQAAEDMDEITLSRHGRRSGSRLQLDLELPPPALEQGALRAEHTYPEWDYTRRCYHPDHCRVLAEPASCDGLDWSPDAATRRRIRAVRRQFEALRPRRQRFAAQRDGEDLDLAALVRSVADRRAGGPGSDRVFVQARAAARDLAVAILMDVSLSTDAWVDNRRVLDVEKESVLALCHGLAACGDDHAVYAFSSRKRQQVNVARVKAFDEPADGHWERRLQALRPGYYTRMGAALRHVAEELVGRPNQHRLLLLLSDGKPNDFDHYEGRYGVEDTRRAIREARRQGLRVFGITVDRKARDYFPYLFGRGGYAMVARPGRLPAALPRIYRQLTA